MAAPTPPKQTDRATLEQRVTTPPTSLPAVQVPGAFTDPGDVFRGTSPVVQGPPVERALSRAFLEVHRHDGRRYELTPWCKSASWTPSVNEPWTTIEFTLVLPWANRNLAPVIGDWVVLRSLSGTPYAWGVIAQEPAPGIEGGVGAVGSIASAGITFRAVSWLRYLREAQIFASPYAIAGRPTSIGTYFSGEDWVARVESLMDELVRGTLGTALVQATTSMMRIQLPPTLGGGMLGDAVQVVYDNESALQAQLQRYRCDPVRGPRIMSAASCFPETTNVLDYLLGIFVPDRRLVEFFETLAPLRQESQATRDALGAVPTLVYRIAPFRTQSLGSFMSANANVPAPTQSGGDEPGSLETKADAALRAEYTAPTWVPSLGNALDYDRDFVNFPTPTRSDAERVNAVTLGLPTQSDSPIRFWQGAGLPFANWDSVARFGFRLYQPNWPYFPPVPTTPTANTTLGSLAQQGARQAVAGSASSGAGDGTTLVGYIRTIAGLAAMMFLGVERYWRGRIIAGQGDQTLRVGLPTTLGWPNGVRFTAYADSITHNVDFGGPQGQCRGTSAVQYSRGAWSSSDERDAPERVPVAVDTTPPPTARQVRTTPAVQSDQCREGTRAATWPTSIADVVLTRIPASLQPWALAAGYPASAFASTADPDLTRRVFVSAACMRVMEYFWRQIDPGALVKVISSVRAPDPVNDPNANHSSGASADYTVILHGSPLGALQTWAALYRLSAQRRIPLGGQGLYLNISAGGMTGALPTQAGASSSRRKPAPAGSSAGVHYDYRSTFGFRPKANANKWVGLDTTGDGTDDYTLGGVRSDETLPLLAERLPSVFAYWRTQGKDDTFLPAVSNTVPNALQMLGLATWCGE